MRAVQPAGGRTRRRPLTLAVALVAALALALPAIAAAHPQVYSLTPKVAPSGCTYEAAPDGACLADATAPRYAVANDGFARTFTENGEAASGGIINYQLIPGGFRKWQVGDVAHQMTAQQILGFAVDYPAQTAVQAHATCDLPALREPATIAAWQGPEPFFDYVPWQKVSGQLGDLPASWIPVVEAKTGVNLAALPSDDPATAGNEEAVAAQALCVEKGGTYYKADPGTNPAGDAIAAAVETAVTPLEAEVGSLLAARRSLQGQLEAWNAKGAALEAEQARLAGQRQGLQRQLRVARRANAKRAKTVKVLRKQLRAARHG